MSPVAKLLEQVRARGVSARVDGDRLILRPASKLPPELVETLRQHKPEILDHLRQRRGLPSDSPDACAWCRDDLADRTRLCRNCSAEDHEPRPPEREAQRQVTKAEPWKREPAPTHGTCPGCGGGLQPGHDDLALCRTCRWTAERLSPGRPQ